MKSPSSYYHGITLVHLCRQFELGRGTTYLSSPITARDPHLRKKIRALVAVENQLGAIVGPRALGSIGRH